MTMTPRRTVLLIVIIMAVIASIWLLHRGTYTAPYKEYSSKFQQRGDKLSDERVLKNVSDSLFAMQMEQLQLKDEIRNELKSNKLNWNDIILSITLLAGAIVGIMGLFFKWQDGKRSDDIFELKQLVVTNHNESVEFNKTNMEQHDKIYDKITLIDNIEIRKNITESLTFVAKKHIHYNRAWLPTEIQLLINGQTQRLIEVSEEIMTEQFDIETLSLAEIKIEDRSREAWKQVIELFGCDFLIKYKDGQEKAISEFKKRLSDIAYSNIVNSKYDRYRASAELFLHDLINNTITEYKKFTETNQNIKNENLS